jgi:hypothetical protein
MPYDYAASVQGVGLRVTRLDANGNLLNGSMDSYWTTSFLRVSFTPEYEDGEEVTEKAADGTVCVSYKAPDTLKRITMEIAICDPDPEITALMSGGLLLSDGSKVQGWASAQVGEDPSGNGVAVEVWSLAIRDGKKDGANPYFHWVFPYVKTRLSGDRVIENGLLATSFEGFGLGNINFRSGPDQKWAYPAATDRPYLYARSASNPVAGTRGFFSVASGGGVTPNQTLVDAATGSNLPKAGNPYAYNPGSVHDAILSSADYTAGYTGVSAGDVATGAALYAGQKNTANVPPADTTNVKYAANPVTYFSRGDTTARVVNLVGGTGTTPTGVTGPTGGGNMWTFTPSSASVPATLNDLNAITFTPPLSNTPWTSGTSIALGTGTAYWDGTRFVAGIAP